MGDKNKPDLDQLIAQITAGAGGEKQKLTAFFSILKDRITFPFEAAILGNTIQIVDFEYHGNIRPGIMAVCFQKNKKYTLSLLDLSFPENLPSSAYLAAYRKWNGLTPWPLSRRQKKKRPEEENAPVELLVTSVKDRAATCLLDHEEVLVRLRSYDLVCIVPGEIISLLPSRSWFYGKRRYMSGKLLSHRIDGKALELVPLKLEPRGFWDPMDLWGDELSRVEEEEIDGYLRPIIAEGKKPSYEMEQVIPGFTYQDVDGPILEAVYYKERGDYGKAEEVLMGLLREDLRCLDAHAHLGNFAFNNFSIYPDKALHHYKAGVEIGNLSIPENFDGVMPWHNIDNRPFFRCLHGYGLCLWQSGRFAEAEKVFARMLRLNPPDNQGIRFLIDEVKQEKPWRSDSTI